MFGNLRAHRTHKGSRVSSCCCDSLHQSQILMSQANRLLPFAQVFFKSAALSMEPSVAEEPLMDALEARQGIDDELQRLINLKDWTEDDWDSVGLAASRLAGLLQVYEPPAFCLRPTSSVPKPPLLEHLGSLACRCLAAEKAASPCARAGAPSPSSSAAAP